MHLLKRFFLFLLRRRSVTLREDYTEELWKANFSKTAAAGFNFDAEEGEDVDPQKAAYEIQLKKGVLVFSLKKANCLAWIEAPERRYRDMIIHAHLKLDPMRSYTAAGLTFRMIDSNTFYLLLVSSKGFFRLDVVRNGTPLPLAGWTEISGTSPGISSAAGMELCVIVWGGRLLILIDGHWAAELSDTSIEAGGVGLALASYEAGAARPYSAQLFLDELSVDSRTTAVAGAFERESAVAEAAARYRLAETFAAMNQSAAALSQLQKAWEGRGGSRTPRELLLGGRLALQLGLNGEAESCIDACIKLGRDSAEGKNALTEKAKLLYKAERFTELKTFAEEAASSSTDPVLHTLLGHAYWQFKQYDKAAVSYDRAFDLDRENGLLAKNAANVYEVLGKKKEALSRYIAAGNCFLALNNYEDLGLLVPKFQSLGGKDAEARALAGKWYFSIEQFGQAEKEFAAAEELRRAAKPRPQKDPSLLFLMGLILIRRARRREALPLLEEAAKLTPDIGIYHFRLAECRFLLSGDAADPLLKEDLERALTLLKAEADEKKRSGRGLDESWGWVNNLAAQIDLQNGDLETAARHLEEASRVLGELPAIRLNRGVYYYLRGSPEEALQILREEKANDPEGLLANCGGNLLVRAGRYEEADEWYRKAISIAPENAEYQCNRASCLIELDRHGEADDILAQVHLKSPSARVLELISYVSAKKGEFQRAEAAVMEALKLDAGHIPSLFSLGWLYCNGRRWKEAEDIIRRLKEARVYAALDNGGRDRLAELEKRYEDGVTRLIPCVLCDRTWRVPREPPDAPAIRLYAMPPDDLPAGTCPQCGNTYCIGCAKEKLNDEGRFICPKCGKPLRLINEGLKKLVADWAGTAIPANR